MKLFEEPLPRDHQPAPALFLPLALQARLSLLESAAINAYRAGKVRQSNLCLASFRALARAMGLTTHVYRTIVVQNGTVVARDLELRVERSAPRILDDQQTLALALSILEHHQRREVQL